jgi:hypothetical protein
MAHKVPAFSPVTSADRIRALAPAGLVPKSVCGIIRRRFVKHGGFLMADASQLAHLEQQHRQLETEIEEAMAHPGTDALTITELKRRKLRLKDEIERLRHETVH